MRLSRLFTVLAILCVGLLPAISIGLQAENVDTKERQVNVKVVTKDDGGTSDVEEVLNVNGNANIEDILRQLGIVDELGDIADDEVVEIIIRRKKDDNVVRDMEIELDPVVTGMMEKRTGQAFLGVHISNPRGLQESKGALITSIIDNTGAAATELQAGDVVTTVDGQTVENYGHLIKIIRSHQPGDVIAITYTRDGMQNTLEATLGERKYEVFARNHRMDKERLERLEQRIHRQMERAQRKLKEASSRPFLGVVLDVNTDDDAVSGLRILRVVDNSSAQQMGLQEDDVINAIDGKPIASFDDLRAALRASTVGEDVTVRYTRNGVESSATAPIQSRANNIDSEKLEKIMGSLPKIKQGLGVIRDFDKSDDIDARDNNVEDATDYYSREVTITISIDDLSAAEAADLSRRTGEDIRADSDLFMQSLEVYPNPNNGAFNLSFELPEDGAAEVKVFDMLGNEIHSESLSGFSGRYSRMIDISDNAQGTYFLQITQNGKSFTQKIISE